MKTSYITSELARLLAFQPVTADQSATKALLSYVASELKACGMQTELSEQDGYSALVAGTQSCTSSTVLLQGHVDVVPATSKQFQLSKRDGLLMGRGVYDMLFATAMYIVLVRELSRSGVLQQLDLGIMLTTDEEIGGFKGVRRLVQDYHCAVCFLPDGGQFDALSIGGRGVLHVTVVSQGTAGHASRPKEFVSPIPELAEVVLRLQETFPNVDQAAASCAITMFHAGEATNQVPAQAELEIDIRFPETDSVEDLLAIVRSLCISPTLEVKVTEKEAAYSTDFDSPYIAAFRDVYRQVVGSEVGKRTEFGSTDGRFFTAKGIPVIMIRPGGGGLHSDTEHLKTADLAPYYTILKAYILQVAKTHE